MKLSLKNIFGIITFACIGLVIARRPLAYAIDNFTGESLSRAGFNFIAPWYFDLYLLGISDYIFDDAFKNALSDKGSPGILPFLSFLFGITFYAISHIIGFIFCCVTLSEYFFPAVPDKAEGKSMDIGVDTNDFTPYSIDEIMELMVDRPIVQRDHHGSETSYH